MQLISGVMSRTAGARSLVVALDVGSFALSATTADGFNEAVNRLVRAEFAGDRSPDLTVDEWLDWRFDGEWRFLLYRSGARDGAAVQVLESSGWSKRGDSNLGGVVDDVRKMCPSLSADGLLVVCTNDVHFAGIASELRPAAGSFVYHSGTVGQRTLLLKLDAFVGFREIRLRVDRELEMLQ